MLMTFLNGIIFVIGSALKGLVSLLPTSPFQVYNHSSVSSYLGGLAWVLPISAIVTVLSGWLTAIGLFYAYSFFMRWLKAIK